MYVSTGNFISLDSVGVKHVSHGKDPSAGKHISLLVPRVLGGQRMPKFCGKCYTVSNRMGWARAQAAMADEIY